MKFLKLIALFTVIYTHVYGQVLDLKKPHYFDKYIEGVFKTIENPPAECLKFLKKSNEFKVLDNKDLVRCYTLIEYEIPKQLKLDILSYSPNLKKRAEAIKNQAIFGTCYLKDPDSKYYDTSYAQVDVKSNKSNEEKLYIDNINSHCNTLHMMQLETNYMLKEIRNKKAKKEQPVTSTIGLIIGSLTVISAVLLSVYLATWIIYLS